MTMTPITKQFRKFKAISHLDDTAPTIVTFSDNITKITVVFVSGLVMRYDDFCLLMLQSMAPNSYSIITRRNWDNHNPIPGIDQSVKLRSKNSAWATDTTRAGATIKKFFSKHTTDPKTYSRLLTEIERRNTQSLENPALVDDPLEVHGLLDSL